MDRPRTTSQAIVGQVAYGVLFCLALPAVMAAWVWRLEAFMPVLPLPPTGWGALAVIAGLALMAWSMSALVRHGRGLPMNAYPTQAWVTSGPFAILFHPIYAAFVLVVAGVAVIAHASAGLYVGAPVAALSAAALVLGYEAPATRRRLGERPVRPWLAIPPASSRPATLFERTGSLVLVFGLWLTLFLSLAELPVQPSAFVTWLPFEAALPFSSTATLLYVMTYGWAVAPVFLVKDTAALRRFCNAALVGTALGCLTYLLCPAQTVPRGDPGSGMLAQWLILERANDSVATAMPSFHVFWSVVAAVVLIGATRSPLARAAMVLFAAAQIVSCHVAGMHSLLDIGGGLLLSAIAVNAGRIVDAVIRIAERVANDWSPATVGPFRIFPHAAFIATAAMTGLTTALAFMLPGKTWVMAVPLAGFVGAALWGSLVEGAYFSRPFGYFGGLLGASMACTALAWAGALHVQDVAALTIGLSFGQAIGRLRCLAQGCCHGSPCEHGGPGLRYRHPLSRVTQIAHFAGTPLKPAPVVSIGFNLLIGAALVRLALNGADAVIILSAYLMATGLARFVEEELRGEPQTPRWKGLSLYQWLSIGLVGAGMAAVFMPPAGALPAPQGPHWGDLVGAAAVAAVWTIGLSVDWPSTGWRLSRLTRV